MSRLNGKVAVAGLGYSRIERRRSARSPRSRSRRARLPSPTRAEGVGHRRDVDFPGDPVFGSPMTDGNRHRHVQAMARFSGSAASCAGTPTLRCSSERNHRARTRSRGRLRLRARLPRECTTPTRAAANNAYTSAFAPGRYQFLAPYGFIAATSARQLVRRYMELYGARREDMVPSSSTTATTRLERERVLPLPAAHARII